MKTFRKIAKNRMAGLMVLMILLVSSQTSFSQQVQLELSKIETDWWSAQWSKETVKEASGYIRLKNRWKSTYIHNEAGALVTGKTASSWWSAMWQLESVSGGYRIKNRNTQTYLQQINGKLKLGEIRTSWQNPMAQQNAKWLVVPVNGESGYFHIINVGNGMFLHNENQKLSPYIGSAATWMGDLDKIIGYKKLHHITIPGTHDSGAFSELFPNAYGRAQTKDIGQQLNDGIRYLNLEIVNVPLTDHFVFAHNMARGDDPVISQLIKIKEFAIQHPKEIIVLDFQELWEWNMVSLPRMSNNNQKKLVEMIETVLGSSIIRKNNLEWLKNSSIFQIQQKSLQYKNNGQGSYNLIVLWNYNEPEKEGDYPTDFITRYSYLDQTYHSGDAWTESLSTQISYAVEAHKTKLKTASSDHMQLLPFCVNSPDMQNGAINYGIKNALEYIPSWKQIAEVSDKLNIIMVDHYNNSNFVGSMISLNL